MVNFLILMKLGACHVETPFIELGQLSTALYFGYFIIIVPVISLIENTLLDLSYFFSFKHYNLHFFQSEEL